MIFSATYKLESKACPGVTVMLRRMGRKRRAGVELQVAGARAKARDAAQVIEECDAKIQSGLDAIPGYRDMLAALPTNERGEVTGKLPAAATAMITREVWALAERKAEAQNQAALIDQSEIYPAFIMATVESIAGIEGLTAEMLCESGPDELFDEVVAAINRNGYQSAEGAANLSQPSTSGVQVDGETKITTAPNASSSENSTDPLPA